MLLKDLEDALQGYQTRKEAPESTRRVSSTVIDDELCSLSNALASPPEAVKRTPKRQRESVNTIKNQDLAALLVRNVELSAMNRNHFAGIVLN